MRIHSPYPASWALAQRIGYLYSEGEIIYLADTPFERLLDIQRQVGQCQTMTSLSQADFEARLEAVFHQNTGESQQIAQDIDQSVDLLSLSEEMPANEDLLNEDSAAADKQDLENLIQLPHGIILVTGPTGSGKSTTLYAILSALNTPGRNILTVEDPVEYELEGIGQTQVNTRVDMSFARGLRAILRQDPDVVMVGEIRDTETAQIAVQASLTGHLVLSTLHTNSASGAVTRLRDMGVESFLLSSSLAGIIAQRLVRRLCPQCRQFTPVSPQQAQMFKYHQLAVTTIGTPVGCPHCHQSGYQGRMAIHEMMVVTPELRAAIHENVDEQALERLVRQQHNALIKNGLQKVIRGDTSWDEVMRVASATLENEA